MSTPCHPSPSHERLHTTDKSTLVHRPAYSCFVRTFLIQHRFLHRISVDERRGVDNMRMPSFILPKYQTKEVLCPSPSHEQPHSTHKSTLLYIFFIQLLDMRTFLIQHLSLCRASVDEMVNVHTLQRSQLY